VIFPFTQIEFIYVCFLMLNMFNIIKTLVSIAISIFFQ
jgi:hypothetical protein